MVLYKFIWRTRLLFLVKAKRSLRTERRRWHLFVSRNTFLFFCPLEYIKHAKGNLLFATYFQSLFFTWFSSSHWKLTKQRCRYELVIKFNGTGINVIIYFYKCFGSGRRVCVLFLFLKTLNSKSNLVVHYSVQEKSIFV